MKKVVRRLGHWLCLVAVGGLSTFVQARQYALVTDTPVPVQSETRETGRTLKQTLSDLEVRFKVHILYNVKSIENKQVSGRFSPADGIENTLEKLLEPHQLRFEKLKPDVYVIVMPKSDKQAIRQIERENLPAAGSTDMASLVKTINLHLPAPATEANAEVAISGRVVSADDNSGLPGVSVVVKGTTAGTVTDGDGRYKLNVPGPASVLVFSFVGYLSEEVTVGNRTTIDMKMAADIKALSEVVVVGYGTQKKSQLTGAIASVSNKEISELPIANAQQALQGRAPGVDVVTNSNKPGAGVSVRIRGRRSFSAGNEPLFVVDGIPLSGGINDINPQDIQSMEILKDASATAIYGSRGANGVVIITTKRGRAGEMSVTYDGYYGVSSSLGRIDMMNGPEFAEYKRESRRSVDINKDGRPDYDNNDPDADSKLFEPIELESIAAGRTTDYQDLMLRNGNQQSHQLGILGGSENTLFSLSGNYFNEQGIIPGQDFTRYTFRVNIDQNISKRIKVGTSTLFAYSIRNGEGLNPFDDALSENPLGVPYDANGELIFLPTKDGLRTNPLNEIVPGAYVDDRRKTRIFNSIYGSWNILDGLNLRVNFGPDFELERRGRFQASLTNARRQGDPAAEREDWTKITYTLENILNYKKTFGEIHALDLTGLYSIQRFREDAAGIAVRGVPAETQQFYNLGQAPIIGGVGSFLEEWTIASYMGRLNYGFKDRYFITLTGRADGSSRFAPGNKWGFFPSLALAWNIGEESFIKNLGFIDNLKLRGSYGITGNTGINPYQTQPLLGRTTYAFGTAGAYGFRPVSISNPNLTWETTASVNAGLDFGFLDGRISGSLDVYQQNTTDLLMERQLPLTSGFGIVLENVGATRNTGIELAVSTVNLDLPNGLRWSTDLNFYSNREEIVQLYGGTQDDVGNSWFIGKPLTVFYDYEKSGIWQLGEEDAAKQYGEEIGQIKIKDQNNDGKINSADRVILGSDIPQWAGGITNRFEFKGFDLSVFLNIRQGSLVRSLFHDNFNLLAGRYNNLDVDYWTPTNPTNAYPQPKQNQEFPKYRSSVSYFDGSFVKVRNIALGYNFPEGIAGKLRMKSLRAYVSAQQPFIFAPYRQKYKGIDPEQARPPDNRNRERTAELSADTPASRLFLFGINAKF